MRPSLPSLLAVALAAAALAAGCAGGATQRDAAARLQERARQDQAQARLLEEARREAQAARLDAERSARRRDEPAPAAAVPLLKVKNPRPVNLQFRDANLKMVFDALARSSGVNFVFDKDVRGDARTTVYANHVTLEDAIDLILATNQLEKKVIGDNSLLIFPASAQKLRDYQELVVRTFYLENADAKNTLNLLKTLLKTKEAFVDEKLNLLVVRDTPEAIRLAEKLIAAQDLADAEVLLEVEIIEVGESRLQELGIKWTDRFQFGLVDPTPGTSFRLDDFRGIDSGRITVNSPSATLSLLANDGRSNVLASPRVRVRNRDKARIMIGDRVPVISSQITPSTGNPVVTETVTYLDVGIKLEVEPNVHLDGDVAIKIALEVSNLGERTTTPNGTIAYRVGTRNATTSLRLRDGETQVLMGLIRDDDRKAASKVPGVGELPLLSHLFGTHTTESNKTEIVLSVTPRIVRSVKPVQGERGEFWSGTEASLRTRPQYARSLAPGGEAKPALPGDAAAAESVSGLQLAWQGPAQARPGEEVTMVLRARTMEALSGAAVQVAFDAAALEFVRIAEGEFMKQGGASTAMNHHLDAKAGTINVRFARSGEGASGEGTLAALTFRAKEGAPSARVRTLAVAPVGRGNHPIALTPPAPHQLAIAP